MCYSIGQGELPSNDNDEITRVLSDHEAARQRFNANSPTFQRIAGRLTRDYIRLAQKRQPPAFNAAFGREG